MLLFYIMFTHTIHTCVCVYVRVRAYGFNVCKCVCVSLDIYHIHMDCSYFSVYVSHFPFGKE